VNYECESYRDVLKEELQRRVDQNPLYSLKAFARNLEIAPSQLSEVFSHKRGLSSDKAKQISKKLQLNKMETDFFVTMVESEHHRSKSKREIARVKLAKFKGAKLEELEEESFKVIRDWYHFAIIELIKMRGFKENPKWIASQLGIQPEQAEQALKRLVRLNMVEKIKGRYKVSQTKIYKTKGSVPSADVRSHHNQMITKALWAIETQSVKERHLFSTTMAIDSSRLEEAQKLIKEFHMKLNILLTERKSKKDKLYAFTTQLFSLKEKQ